MTTRERFQAIMSFELVDRLANDPARRAEYDRNCFMACVMG